MMWSVSRFTRLVRSLVACPSRIPVVQAASSISSGLLPIRKADYKSPMMLSTMVRAHKPMIKFLGTRLPKPHFDRSLFPLDAVARKQISSVAPQSHIPRGQGIDFSELPDFLKPKLISEEECMAINSGGATLYDTVHI